MEGRWDLEARKGQGRALDMMGSGQRDQARRSVDAGKGVSSRMEHACL